MGYYEKTVSQVGTPNNSSFTVDGSSILPYSIAVDSSGNLFFSDQDTMIRFLNITDEKISMFAGNTTAGFHGENISAKFALFSLILSITFDPNDNMVICDTLNDRVRQISKADGIVRTIVGGGNLTADHISAINRKLQYPYGVAISHDGSIFIACALDNLIVRIRHGVATNFAGMGSIKYADGVYSFQMQLDFSPNIGSQLMLYQNRSLFVVDTEQYILQRIDINSTMVSIVAGNGTSGPANESPILANVSLIKGAGGLCVDPKDNTIYLVDTGNSVVRRISASTGIIETIAGSSEVGYRESNGQQSSFLSSYAVTCAVDRDGNVIFADRGNSVIRKIVLYDEGNSVYPSHSNVNVGLSFWEGSGIATGCILFVSLFICIFLFIRRSRCRKEIETNGEQLHDLRQSSSVGEVVPPKSPLSMEELNDW